jgi:hypothetical protein
MQWTEFYENDKHDFRSVTTRDQQHLGKPFDEAKSTLLIQTYYQSFEGIHLL